MAADAILWSSFQAARSGQFLTPDSLKPNGAGTQAYDPYSYANGNPVTLTDPSGHAATGGLAGLGQAVAALWKWIARVIDCAFVRECYDHREHTPEGYNPLTEEASGSGRSRAVGYLTNKNK